MSDVVQGNAIVDLGRSAGQLLIGAFIATALWGMTCNQSVLYFSTYPKDPRYLKILVLLLWLLDTVHEVLCIIALWQTLVPRFGDLVKISIIHPDLLWQGLIGSIVAFISRGFFTWRIWIFSNKNWIFPILLIPPSIGDTVGTFVWASRGAGKPVTFLATPSMFKLSVSVTSIIAATDSIIAITMVTLLWKRRTGVHATDRILLRLMRMSVNTGAWTAVFGLTSAITLAVWPHDLFDLLVQLPISALYCNAVLANLNSRKFIAGTDTIVDIFSREEYSGISIGFGAVPSSRSRGTSHAGESQGDIHRRSEDRRLQRSEKNVTNTSGKADGDSERHI